MKKLVFFLPDITTSGGVEKVVSNLANRFAQSPNYQVLILTCIDFDQPFFYEVSPKVSLFSLNRPAYPRGAFAKIKWYQELIKPLDQFLLAHEIAIIFAEGSYLSLCLTMIKNEKVIKVGCEHISHDAVNIFHQGLRRINYRKLDALVVLTKLDRAYFSSFLTNVFLIPNFILPFDQRAGSLKNKTIVATGRLESQKGFDILIKAFAKIHSQFLDWNLIIYGEGSERRALESLVDQYSLSQSIKMPGRVFNLSDKLKNALIFVAPSRYEGFPLALLEAMGLGLLCVSSNISGSNEIIQHQINGILVKPKSISALANALCNLIMDQESWGKMSAAALKKADQYQIDSIIIEWEKLIDHLIGQNIQHEI